MNPVMDADALDVFLRAAFPHLEIATRVIGVGPGRVTLRQPYHPEQLRPGETLSGPTLMTLADTAMYLLVVAHVGPEPMAVTAHLSMDFLRRPRPAALVAEATLLKLGRTLAVGHVVLRSEGDDAPVAAAQVTYALPAARA